jgi:short-subunit dehydrogenase
MALLAAAAGVAALARTRKPPREAIAGEVAVVTGASRGLGLLLARELSRDGCRLVICARDQAELDRAADELRSSGADVTAVACDVAADEAPRLLIDTAVARYGRIDVLINNAGLIQVGPLQSTGEADYEVAWRTMTFAPIRLTLAALPVMRRQAHGRIVNVTSIGGKVSVPHLLPYSAAKFGATAFSEGLRAELGAGPITVTTVVPGLMRTGSHLRAQYSGHRSEEFTWFSLGASLPLVSMDAERAARQIVDAMRDRRSEVILTPAGQVVARAAAIAPELTSAVLHLAQRLLMPPATDDNGEPLPGHALRPAFASGAFDTLTALGRSAAHRFNEAPPADDARRGDA